MLTPIMKSRIFTAAIIIGFASIAVFGFAGMNHGGSHAGCIAATATRSACPENSADSVAFHANVFRAFSNAPLVPTVLALIVFTALALAAAGAARAMLRRNTFCPVPLSRLRSRSADTRAAERELFLRSLALRELSPTFS